MPKQQMKIGIDARPLSHNLTGIGRYTYNVVINLIKHYPEVDWFLYSDRPLQEQSRFEYPNVKIRHGRNSHSWGSLLCSQAIFPIWAMKDQLNTFWSPRHHLPILLGLSRHLRKVVTVHDIVWKKHPETMSKSSLTIERLFFPLSTRMANSIITVSDFTKSELINEFGFTANKTQTIPLQSFIKDIHTIHQLPKPTEHSYILFVGTLEPRKNLVNLLRAFSNITCIHKHLRLIIVGKDGWGELRVSELIEQLGLTKRVIITGFIPDEHLLSLYKHCEVLAMPSIYEGFGLPALEALSMNKKVVISRLNALADIVGDNIFITDVDQQSIAEALNKAIVSEPENFADIGNDWVSVAQKTLQMLVCNR